MRSPKDGNICGALFGPTPNPRTSKLRNDILMFQQHQGESLFEAWTRFKDLLQKVPHHGATKEDESRKGLYYYQGVGIIRGGRMEEFEGLMMKFILDQEEKVCQLEEYMSIVGNEFMQLSLKVMEKLMDEKRIKENKKIQKITKSPDTEELGSSSNTKSLGSLIVETLLSYLKFGSLKSLCVKYIHTIFPISPLVRESSFGFKPSTKNKRNVKSRHDAKNSSPQSYPQVLPSFKVYTPPVTYPEEVEETLGTRLLGQSGSQGVDSSNLEIIENDWEIESKEVSFLGRGLNSPVRPKEVENVGIRDSHHLEHIIQQLLFLQMAPSHHNGRKSHLLGDKQIPGVGVFDETFGGNTRDLGFILEETGQEYNFTPKQGLKNKSQMVETASGKLATPSGSASDRVRKSCDGV
ncbi:hypothetical protein Tco_0140126 [Tanacetum coccineum]